MYKSPLFKLLMFAWVLSLPVTIALAAEKSEPKKSKLPGSDEGFVKEAVADGMMEVELGQIAGKKAANDQVKQFGRRMQDDHGKANEELKTLAINKGVQLPTALEGKHKKTVDRLSKLSGEEFDRQYMRAMVNDHKEDVEKFQREADKGKDPDVKQFANKQLPVLKKHLEMARAADRQVKDSGKAATKESGTSKESKERGR